MFQVVSILVLLGCFSLIVSIVCKKMRRKDATRILQCIFVVYVLGYFYCTFFSRVSGLRRLIDLRPFHSYFELFRDSEIIIGGDTGLFAWFMKDASPVVGFILNILLFYPLGYLLPILFPKLKPKHVILIGCLCSVVTEVAQYLLKKGWCETDDVIHNTLGTAIGVWVWHLQSKRLNKQNSNELPKE